VGCQPVLIGRVSRADLVGLLMEEVQTRSLLWLKDRNRAGAKSADQTRPGVRKGVMAGSTP